MSGASVAVGAGSRPSRYHILYPRQNLREFRSLIVVWFLGSLALGAYEYFSMHAPQTAYISALYALFPLTFGLALYLYGLVSTVTFDADGLSVRYGPFRKARVDWADIDRARLETVQNIWQHSGRKPTRMIKSLYKQRALCLKLKGDGELAYGLSRRLGARLVFDDDLVLPVADVENAMGALKDGLQQHRQARSATAPRRNQRRGRRGRR